MKKLTILLFISLLIFSCTSNNSRKNDAIPVGVHEIVAKEAIDASAYTYVRAEESGKEVWIAIPRTVIKIGAIYFYQGGMQMEKFESKDLKRTFDSVLFLEGLSDTKDNLITKPVASMKNQKSMDKHTNINSLDLKKIDVTIKTAKGGITIAELFSKKDAYSGKSVKISGQVTKYSPDIMKKNWIHLQDGTENAGKFDLTVTTEGKVAVGDIVTVEGKIAINKDFGYGYSYEVLMEDALVTK
jgi:hypothetical protein